jgi:hypothetical protein
LLFEAFLDACFEGTQVGAQSRDFCFKSLDVAFDALNFRRNGVLNDLFNVLVDVQPGQGCDSDVDSPTTLGLVAGGHAPAIVPLAYRF